MREGVAQAFPGCAGLWLALSLIKFGNPVILADQITPPETVQEFLHQAWPVEWGYAMAGGLFLLGLFARRRTGSSWTAVAFLPLFWLIWQLVASLGTIDGSLTRSVLPHFLVSLGAFYLGYWCLGSSGSWRAFWLAVGGGWLVVVAIGWRQHFGGLAELREYFYSQPDWRQQSPAMIAKISSERIYSTLVYPNTLATVLLLFTPPIMFGIWQRFGPRPIWLRCAYASVPIVGAGACLIWSGSKAGWIVALGMIVVAVVGRVGVSPRHWIGAGLVLLLGFTGFFYRYSDYFSRGATSVSARLDYWRIAASNTWENPVMGTGPGTFMRVYQAGKPNDAEMTRLAHNDYLQQASDSGLPGALFYVVFVGAMLWLGRGTPRMRGLQFGLWLGLLGAAVQNIVEFGLYIPAVAWPCFMGFGALLHAAQDLKTVDNPNASA